MHHPPISKPARHFKRLVDGGDFRAALARQGAELVIHGHDHVHSLIELDGPQRPHPGRGRAVGLGSGTGRDTMAPATISTGSTATAAAGAAK